MSDDIVTRLRDVPLKFWIGVNRTTLNPYHNCCVEAADEIERLREIVRLLKYSIEHQVCECSHCLSEEGAS